MNQSTTPSAALNMNAWAWTMAAIGLFIPLTAIGAIVLGVCANKASNGRVGTGAALAGVVVMLASIVGMVLLYAAFLN